MPAPRRVGNTQQPGAGNLRFAQKEKFLWSKARPFLAFPAHPPRCEVRGAAPIPKQSPTGVNVLAGPQRRSPVIHLEQAPCLVGDGLDGPRGSFRKLPVFTELFDLTIFPPKTVQTLKTEMTEVFRYKIKDVCVFKCNGVSSHKSIFKRNNNELRT